MLHTIDDRGAGAESGAAAREEELARQEAIKQIERKRRFWITTVVSTGVVGGLIAYLRKPIPESQIKREIKRQARA